MIKIAASILASDFGNLQQEIQNVEQSGATLLHIDVMDGHFVPNLSLGLPIVESIRKNTKIFFDVHLMISNPLFYAEKFIAAGADGITIHIEGFMTENGTVDELKLFSMIDLVKNRGKKIGISLKPKTHPELIFPYLKLIDMVLVMTVEPGFGGQTYIKEMTDKIAIIRKYSIEQNIPIDIEVDGGIDINTAPIAVRAGANILVAGSAIFSKPDYKMAINELKQRGEKSETKFS